MSDRDPILDDGKAGEEVIVDNSPNSSTSGESSTVTSETVVTTIAVAKEILVEVRTEEIPVEVDVVQLRTAVSALSTDFGEAATVTVSDSKSEQTRSDAPTSSSGGTDSRSGTSANVLVRPPSVQSGSGSGSGSGHRQQKTIYGWEGQTFAPRPGVCKAGQNIKVISNHYELKYPDYIDYFLYNVEMKVKGSKGAIQMKKREEMRPLFWNLVEKNENVFGSIGDPTHLIYNDCNLLYTRVPLRFDQGRGEQRFKLPIDNRPRSKICEIHIKATGMQRADPNSQLVEQQHAMVTLLDLILSQRVRCDLHKDSRRFVPHGSSVFFVPQINWDTMKYNGREEEPPFKFCYDTGRGMAGMIGLHGAVKLNLQHHRILYNVDLSSSVYRKHGRNLLLYIFELTKLDRKTAFDAEDLQRLSMNSNNRDKLTTELKGLSMRTTYKTRAGLKRRYTFFKLHDKNAHSAMLDPHNSVADYYRHYYNIILEYPLLPLVQIHKTKSVFIPMELLELSEYPQKVKGQPPEEQLGCLIREAVFEPSVRKGMIEYLAGQTGRPEAENQSLRNDDPYMKAWNVGVIQEMQTINAKVLPRPQLEFPNGDIVDGPVNGEWPISDPSSNALRKVLIPPSRKVAFGLVYVNNVIDIQPDIDHFYCLMETLFEFGVPVIQKDPIITLHWKVYRGKTYFDNLLTDVLTQFRNDCEGRSDKPIPIVLFIFERKDPFVYSVAKMISERECSVFCQGILLRNYRQMNEPVSERYIGDGLKPSTCATAQNMFLKINGKLGGVHYRLAPEGTHKNWTKIANKKEPTLFLGVDVCHPTKAEIQARVGTSLAAIVGNIDIDCMQYRCSWRLQKTGEERIVSMTDEIQARIAAFAENTGVQPKHIVMYRDGVAENEFKKTLYEEKKSFDAAIKRISTEGYQPTFTYIVCSKRHHTRFFATDPKDTCGKVGNLRPGILVEQTVCTKDFFDFYILSHAGPLGTSRPTHYYVLHDDWAPSTAFWQTITYALCFTYIRTPKAVSLPAPVYYAHLAAKRGKVWLDAYDRLRQSEFRNKSEWQTAIMRNEAANCSLDGMIFV